MNALSWSLYAADVLGSLKIALCVLAGAFGPIAFIVTACQRDGTSYSWSNSEPWPYPKGLFAVAIICAIFACVIPSPQTVYMIAASEAGERAIQTPEAREMVDLIRRKLREILTDKA